VAYRLGIGTNAPQSVLHITGSQDAENFRSYANGAAQGRYLYMMVDSSHSDWGTTIGTGAGGKRLYVGDAGGMAIGAYVASNPPANGIICSGNVGIGTASPTNKLDVIMPACITPMARQPRRQSALPTRRSATGQPARTYPVSHSTPRLAQ
jgi:hypothetical protein